MVSQVHANHSKIKVGMLIETPFLPVSDSVKRAINLTRKALVDEGYDVVDVNWTPEEFAEARNLLIGMVASGAGPGLVRDMDKSGERLTPGVWLNIFMLKRGSFTHELIKGLMRLIGMGRAAACIEEVNIKDNENYEKLLKRRNEFNYRMSRKWQDLKLTAMVTPTFPHCAFKSANADDMGLFLEYIFMWNTLNYPCGSMPVT